MYLNIYTLKTKLNFPCTALHAEILLNSSEEADRGHAEQHFNLLQLKEMGKCKCLGLKRSGLAPEITTA